MSRLIYATHLTCDGCGTTEKLPAPTARPEEISNPPGWLPYGCRIVDLYQTPVFSDLCGTCMQRPLAELLERKLTAISDVP